MAGDIEGRQFVIQRSLMGGLATNTDIINSRDEAMWADCQNMIISNPTGYLDGSSTSRTVTTPPPTQIITGTTYSPTVFTYSAPVSQTTIATFENTDWPNETWSFSGTGTASLTTAISEGDQALSLACTASQTAVGTCTLPAAATFSTASGSVLAVDTNWNNISHFSSGYIRIGTDSSNYRQYNITAPVATGNTILKFDAHAPSSTVGSPTTTNYVSISLTATAGGSITVIFDNLRTASFSSSSMSDGNIVTNGANVYNAAILDGNLNSNTLAESSFIFTSGDALFVGALNQLSDNLPNLGGQVIKAGFTNTLNASSGTNFYFAQFQNPSTPSQNIEYYVNGKDGYFSYDPNASAGSQNARIASTAYKYICSHRNMIMLAGNPAAPNAVQPSDVNDPTTLTAVNAVTLPDISGSYVTGLISMDEYLAILRNDGIWKLYGSNPDSATTDFNLLRSNAKSGPLEMKSACKVGRSIYYFDGNEICVFDGNESVSVSGPLDSLFTGYSKILCSIYYNEIRDLVVFNFVPDSFAVPVSNKTTFFQLTFCPTFKAWGKMGAFDDAVSVQFFGLAWAGSAYSKPLVFNGGLQFYQVDPSTPTAISMPWFIKTQWNEGGRPDLIKDHDSFTWYVRDQSSINKPASTVVMYSDFDPSTARQTFQAQNEIQTITPSTPPDAGLWRITYSGYETTDLNWNDSAATIQAALEALASIGSGNVVVTGTLATLVTLTFQGTLAGTNLDPVTITANSLTKTTASVSLYVNTTQDGNTYYPTNNAFQLATTGVSGRSVASKLSGTCTDQKTNAVMVSGYSFTWSEIENI